MLQSQREHLAGLATEQITALFKSAPGAFYQEGVQAKLLMLLQAVDRAAFAVDKPVLFTEILPGFDLVVLRNPDIPVVGITQDALDSRALSSVDETCLALLSQALEPCLKAQSSDDEQGAFIYQGDDGLHYLGFRTRFRTEMLAQIGVAPDGLVTLSGGSLQ